MEHIKIDELIDVYFPIYCILSIPIIIISLPNYNPIYSILQSIIINLYIYGFHYMLHYLTSKYTSLSKYDLHISIHHNKNIILPRWLEITIETIENISWFMIILIVQYIFNIHIFSSSLVLFIGFLYTFIHTFDYSLYVNNIHKEHHIHSYCNYEPRIFDIIFNTRCDTKRPYESNMNELYFAPAAFGLAYALKVAFGLD